MKSSIKRGFAAIVLLTLLILLCTISHTAAKGYRLVFSDEFDYYGEPDASKWTADEGNGRNGWGNGEAQYYTRSGNAWVDGENLVIEARCEEREGCAYTSAKLLTEGLHAWQGGIVEVRAKLPVELGTWSAIWMQPEDKRYGGWVDSGEIDVVEYVGAERGIVYSSIHTHTNNSSLGNPITADLDLGDAAEEFHTYRLEWTDESMTILVDGNALMRYDRPEVGEGEEGWQTWPFDLPFYLVMNVAVGGSWGGYNGIDDESFPARMFVDYVRVYQLAK